MKSIPVNTTGGAGTTGGGHTGITRGRGADTQVTRASAESGIDKHYNRDSVSGNQCFVHCKSLLLALYGNRAIFKQIVSVKLIIGVLCNIVSRVDHCYGLHQPVVEDDGRGGELSWRQTTVHWAALGNEAGDAATDGVTSVVDHAVSVGAAG